MTERRCADVLVVGAGFGGSLLARALRAQGCEVILVERDRHPRFALGESTTPLANLALERLAARYGLEDLWHLATWGRWRRRYPHLRCGKKRGFTFYRHRPGLPYRAGAGDRDRLLVAASPDDHVADTQWLREDVDGFLVERAVAEGVEYHDRTEIERCLPGRGAVRSRARTESGTELEITAAFVVDATGPGGLLARSLGLAAHAAPMGFESWLVYGHFRGARPFSEIAAGLPRSGAPGEPYEEQWAAVHHLLDVGWMYQLRFDDGRTSAGFLIDPGRASARGLELDRSHPEQVFEALLRRYPTLGRQLEEAEALFPLAATGVLQRRLGRAAGARWALLPQAFAFHDPLFSTGIAWTLLGVERLAEALAPGRSATQRQTLLARYRRLLDREADHLEHLLRAAYSRFEDFDGFCAVSRLYFAAASHSELRQRLLGRHELGASPDWPWQGFLGATDGRLAGAFRRLAVAARSPLDAASLERSVAAEIEPFDVVGLLDPSRRRLVPADLASVRQRCRRLGLRPRQLAARLPRLRGKAPPRR